MGLEIARQRSKSLKEAYPPSAAATISRCGCQRLTSKSICQAHSVMGSWRLPCSVAYRSEWARAQGNGKAHLREAHGTGAGSVRHTHLSQSAGFHEVAVRRAHRAPIDPLGTDLLSLAALQRLVDTHHQRSIRDESFYKRFQQDAAHLHAGPFRPAQDPVVAMESLVLVRTHRFQIGR